MRLPDLTGCIVLVEWHDAHSCSDGGAWSPADSVIESAEGETTCYSLGFVLRQTPRTLTLVAHVGGEEMGGDMTIPTGMITRLCALDNAGNGRIRR